MSNNKNSNGYNFDLDYNLEPDNFSSYSSSADNLSDLIYTSHEYSNTDKRSGKSSIFLEDSYQEIPEQLRDVNDVLLESIQDLLVFAQESSSHASHIEMRMTNHMMTNEQKKTYSSYIRSVHDDSADIQSSLGKQKVNLGSFTDLAGQLSLLYAIKQSINSVADNQNFSESLDAAIKSIYQLSNIVVSNFSRDVANARELLHMTEYFQDEKGLSKTLQNRLSQKTVDQHQLLSQLYSKMKEDSNCLPTSEELELFSSWVKSVKMRLDELKVFQASSMAANVSEKLESFLDSSASYEMTPSGFAKMEVLANDTFEVLKEMNQALTQKK